MMAGKARRGRRLCECWWSGFMMGMLAGLISAEIAAGIAELIHG